jgi:hypothetical protein
MPPEVLEKIVDVEMGKPSEPFPYGDGYAVAQVLDIHREGITEQELQSGARRKKIEERLYNIQSDSIVHVVMDSILSPLDVRVRGPVVEDLAPFLYEWVQKGLPDRRSLFDELEAAPDSTGSYKQQIDRLLDKVLVSYAGGVKKVRDFIDYMDYYRSVFNQSTSYTDFENRMITEIGRMMKNDVFIDIAEQEGLADSADFREDLRLWRNKWTYDIYRNRSVLELQVSEEEMRDFFRLNWRELGIADVDTTRFYKYRNAVHNAVLHRKQLAQLDKDIQRLRENYEIWVNEDLLDNIELVDDSITNRTSYFIRKNFNFEAVSPTVDMKWVSL